MLKISKSLKVVIVGVVALSLFACNSGGGGYTPDKILSVVANPSRPTYIGQPITVTASIQESATVTVTLGLRGQTGNISLNSTSCQITNGTSCSVTGTVTGSSSGSAVVITASASGYNYTEFVVCPVWAGACW